ncbi:UDP-glycosyltransferase 13-like [Brachypodium distachyon]|nr:UDP-glycosyltransferase 13-like [Brachypodium distachyon]|eukprot:XP_014754031.1 UDP-glycosyltransferase 13-like [Brachypodium distachyon]
MASLSRIPDADRILVNTFESFESLRSKEQLREISVGLENSGHRFLWVVLRAPLSDPDLEDLLPGDSWSAPVAVATSSSCGRRRSTCSVTRRPTGPFVTHCGWNSVLEALTAGVPMLCWPPHSEQKMNKVVMVEEIRVAAEMVGLQEGMLRPAR